MQTSGLSGRVWREGLADPQASRCWTCSGAVGGVFVPPTCSLVKGAPRHPAEPRQPRDLQELWLTVVLMLSCVPEAPSQCRTLLRGPNGGRTCPGVPLVHNWMTPSETDLCVDTAGRIASCVLDMPCSVCRKLPTGPVSSPSTMSPTSRPLPSTGSPMRTGQCVASALCPDLGTVLDTRGSSARSDPTGVC